MKKTGNSLRKLISMTVAVLLIIASFIVGYVMQPDKSYASETWGTELNIEPSKGSYVSGQYSGSGETTKYNVTIPIKGMYKVELYGPSSESGRTSGSVIGSGLFEAGDVLYFTLGREAKNGANYVGSALATGGEGGHGYIIGSNGSSGIRMPMSAGTYGPALGGTCTTYNDGTYVRQADVRLNTTSYTSGVFAVAAGAGGDGGRGEGSYGQFGGTGAIAGLYTIINNGSASSIGDAENCKGGNGGVGTKGATASGYDCSTGSAGGGAGANYVDASVLTSYSSGGGYTGSSKFVLTYVGEWKPDNINDVTYEGLMAIARALAGQAIGEADIKEDAIPILNVVAGKHFSLLTTSYDDMASGSAGGVTATNNSTTDKIVEISGVIMEPGNKKIIINGKIFIFHVLAEPDSANVQVIFN